MPSAIFFLFFLFFLFHYLELSLYAQRTHRELFFIFFIFPLYDTHIFRKQKIIFSFPGSFNKSRTQNIFFVCMPFKSEIHFFLSVEITLLEFFEYFLNFFLPSFYGNNSSLFFITIFLTRSCCFVRLSLTRN